MRLPRVCAPSHCSIGFPPQAGEVRKNDLRVNQLT
jgi:hypothetical protein